MKKLLFPDATIIITKHFDIHQDWEVPISGFFIIASKRKISSIVDFNKKEVQEFSELLYKLRKGMKDILKIENVYLFQREDSRGGFHLWIFPRLSWMKKFGRKIESIRPIIDYAKEKMVNEKTRKEIEDMVKKMKNYMK